MSDLNVHISGMGIVSALGSGIPETLQSLTDARIAASSLTLFSSTIDAPVFEVSRIESEIVADEMRTLTLCRLAVQEALAQANLDNDCSHFRMGVCMGTTVACQLNDLEFYRAYKTTGDISMPAVDRYLKGNLAEAIARTLGATGPTTTIVNACSSSAEALGVGASWIRNKICDLVIAGGADELSRVPLSGFHSLGIMSPEPCRPFDKNRKGLNLGEGAGVMVLESEEHALQRNCPSNLSLAGYAAACDAYHLTAPRPDGSGLKQAITGAMTSASVAASDIAFVNAHGTATPDNDRVEGNALADIMGSLPILSTKGYTGHTLGAAGGIEAVLCALALENGWIPLSAGFSCADEDIPFVPVQRTTPITGRYALSTSLAFGGNNSAILIGHQPGGGSACI